MIYYNNDKCFLVLLIYASLLCFISFFYRKKKIIALKKASGPKFCNIIFLFLPKIGSIESVDQQINLVSSY